ncbi:Isy1-like splicing family-domain-containing protein [Mycena pura]|uniref:Isy1-like splicing family-domain-containing protein n=1 Tax=Mycena pura TaxID=153505 RepID=A0AAD6Y6J6_9AGAR|nr:Isy1-like splicing family-domain-containing protein [Mycena pura]
MSDPPTPALPELSSDDKTRYDDLLRWLDFKVDIRDDMDNVEEEERPRKRRKSDNDAWDEDTGPYYAIRAARYFKRAINVHLKPSLVFAYGAQMSWGIVSTWSAAKREKRAPYVDAFEELLKYAPELSNVLQRMHAVPSKGHWQRFIDKFDKIAKDTRSNDTTSLKPVIGQLIVPNPDKDVLDPPIGRREAKTDRGFQHPVLRLLLMGPPDRDCFPPTNYRSKPAPAVDWRDDRTLYDAYLHSPLQRTLSSDSEVKGHTRTPVFTPPPKFDPRQSSTPSLTSRTTFHPLCSRRTRLLQGPSPPALTSSRLPYAFAAVPDVYRGREGFTLSFNAVVLMRPGCAVLVDIPGLSNYELRDLNDEINKLMREKRHWENQIVAPITGGTSRFWTTMGGRCQGPRGYKYFDRAKELPACARRCRRRLCPLHVAAAARALCTPPSPPVPSAAALHAAICLYATAAHCHPRLCTSPSARHHRRVYAPRAFCMHPVPSACARPLHAPCRCRLCPLHVAPTALALCMPPSPPVPSDAARRHLSVHRRRPLHATTALCTQHARVATRHHRRLRSLYTQDLSAVAAVSLY